MGEEQFLELLKLEEGNRYSAQEAALNILRTEFRIEVKPNAYQYVKSLQASFDYSTIPFSEDYYDALGIER